MLAKARSLPADEIVIDLEDSVAPDAEGGGATAAVARAIAEDWMALGDRGGARQRNGDATGGRRREGAGRSRPRCTRQLVIPRSRPPPRLALRSSACSARRRTAPARAADRSAGADRDGRGLVRVGEIAGAGLRLETMIVGYADMSVSLGRPPEAAYPVTAGIGCARPVLVNARAAGLPAIDGPLPGRLRRGRTACLRAERSRPRLRRKVGDSPAPARAAQRDLSPRPRRRLERARAVLDALEAAGERGAVQLDGEMIDEASRKGAEQLIARGKAAGLERPRPRPDAP